MSTPEHCPKCGTPYGKRRRCYKCTGTQTTSIERICLTCGKSFRVPPNVIAKGKGKFCSTSCGGKFRIGPRAGHWKGGRTVSRYIYVTIPNIGTVEEHRHVMAQHMGRPLRSDEQVHHVNGDKTDNRIENLKVVTPKEHAQYHLTRSSRLKGRWAFGHEQCASCGRTDRKHRAHGLCATCYINERRHQAPSRTSMAIT